MFITLQPAQEIMREWTRWGVDVSCQAEVARRALAATEIRIEDQLLWALQAPPGSVRTMHALLARAFMREYRAIRMMLAGMIGVGSSYRTCVEDYDRAIVISDVRARHRA